MGINLTLISYNISNDHIELNEKQTAIIPVLLKDDSGSLITPTILRWQLTDKQGNIKNGRSYDVVQTTLDKIVLNYTDTTIVDDDNKLILSIAAGAVVNGIGYQQNAEVKIKLKSFVNSPPNVLGSLDSPFDDLDDPFDDLDDPF